MWEAVEDIPVVVLVDLEEGEGQARVSHRVKVQVQEVQRVVDQAMGLVRSVQHHCGGHQEDLLSPILKPMHAMPSALKTMAYRI